MLTKLKQFFGGFLSRPSLKAQFEEILAAPNQETPIVDRHAYTPMTRKEQAAPLIRMLISLESTAEQRRTAALTLRDLKRRERVSYAKLGLSETDQMILDALLNELPKPPKVSAKTKALSAQLHSGQSGALPNKAVNDRIREARDAEIEKLSAMGFTEGEIAKQLGVARSTVNRVVSNFVG